MPENTNGINQTVSIADSDPLDNLITKREILELLLEIVEEAKQISHSTIGPTHTIDPEEFGRYIKTRLGGE